MKQHVALIVNCYNSQEYLEETLLSLCKQTFPNFEIVCVDNHSTDQTTDIIKKISKSDTRIKLLSTSKHIPLVHARSEALDYVKSITSFTHFAFCDSDDLWSSEWLEKLMSQIGKRSLAFSNGFIISNNGNIDQIVTNCLSHTKYDAFSSLLYLQSVVFSSELLSAENFLDKNFSLLYDMDLFLRLQKDNASYVHISDNLFKYRVHQNSASNSKKVQVFKERHRITLKYGFNKYRFYLKGFVHYLGLTKFAKKLLSLFR